MYDKPKQTGGFRFDDEPAPKKKKPGFGFTVEDAAEQARRRRESPEAPARAQKEGKTEKKEKPRRAPPERKSDDADPGTWEWPTLGIVIVLLPLVIWLQQWSRYLRGETLTDAPAEVRRSEAVEDPGVSELAVMSKLTVKLTFMRTQRGPHPSQQALAEEEGQKKDKKADSKPPDQKKPDPHAAPAHPQPPADAGADEEESEYTTRSLERIAWTRVDRLRVAIVAGEVDGPRAALDRLTKLETEADPGGDLAAEIHWVKMIYQKGPGAIPPEAAESIRARHGWFGRLALSFTRHPSDAERWEVVAGGGSLIGVTFGLIGFLILVTFLGLVACIFALIRFKTGGYTLEFIPPAPGGSVFLETFGVFLAGFALLLLIELLLFGLGVEGTGVAAGLGEVLTWSLVAAVFWPVARGMPWREWAASIGWHRGDGIFKEVMCGVMGYLASQPIVWVGRKVGHIVEIMTDSVPPAAKFGYGMFQAPAQGSWLLFVLSIMTAVLWAPVVEESIFRGAMFRYLRGRCSLLWSILISAALFGMIHPYSPSGLVEVGTSGIVFGFLRAWRGSLIAPMTAHAIHNGLISSISVVVVGMLGS